MGIEAGLKREVGFGSLAQLPLPHLIPNSLLNLNLYLFFITIVSSLHINASPVIFIKYDKQQLFP